MEVKIVNQSRNELPAYSTALSAGMDLRADLEQPIVLKPLERVLVPTGLFIELPVGHEAQIRPRSGLAIKKGVTVLNSPGTIDADYRGEVKVILVNLSNEEFVINHGERICQMVIAKHETVAWKPVEILEETERGAGGFGHTGKN
ncbi:dUTP diphosphatase [Sunxiuqinia dokdonensis]|uniref:Deoxyuridine 5'-triphosphate nucleotidohydrolase n=1 Tax=Sunxiuqinia dokdonensis TaxID=1409788 RepID=A0A0L8V5S0_9BACT|nr:dUTP diphosphatase [Sunxiuqinia dokdonensis]KOH43789.1 deoxyuridine 5'-triphosphate nucleotidohydrolase [Sunxiuqinia dokdonensis]